MTNEADGNPEPRDRRAVRRKRSPPAQAGQTAISGEGAGRGAPPADGRARAPRARQAGPRVDHRRVGSAGGVKALPAPLPADFLRHPGHFASHSLLVAHYSSLSTQHSGSGHPTPSAICYRPSALVSGPYAICYQLLSSKGLNPFLTVVPSTGTFSVPFAVQGVSYAEGKAVRRPHPNQ